MFFINDQHKKNYEHLTTMVFRSARKNPEYHSTAYILAIPEVYKRCIHDPWLYEFPYLWTRDYEDRSETRYDEDLGENFLVVDFDIPKDEEGNEKRSTEFFHLASGHQKLVKLGENLFNCEDTFNLTEALGVWDDHQFKVYQQAVLIRINREVQGLSITLR